MNSWNGTPRARLRNLLSASRDLVRRGDKAALAQRHAALALVIRVGSAGLAYLAQVVLARYMGQFEFGIFAYTWAWFLVFSSIASLGFGDSPLRYIALFRHHRDAAHLRGFIRFSVFAILAASAALGALLIAWLPYASQWIDAAYLVPLALMALCVPFAALQGFLEGLGRSYGWMLPALVPVYLLRHGLLLVFMIAAVALGFEASAITAFVCVILVLVVSLTYQASSIMLRLRRVLEPAKPAYRPREWLRGSFPFAIFYSSQHLASFADVLVLSFFVGPAEIAIYFAATRIIQVVNLVPYAATVGSAHLFAAAHASGDHHELQRLCRHVAVTTFVVATIAAGAIILSGEWLLGMFGNGFEAGYVPLAILAVGVMARVIVGPAEDILNMSGHSSVSAATYVAVIVLNVALAVVLIGPLGINGVAIASATALVVRAVWLLIAARGRLGIDTSIVAALGAFLSGTALRRSELQAPAE